MKKLQEYETPTSNEASFARWTNHAGIQCKTETDSVPVVVARDLERKLALAMDALREIERDGYRPMSLRLSHPTDIAEEALREIENENTWRGIE
jgi:hypothetical protein